MSEIVVFLKEWLPTAAVGIVPVYLFLKQDIRHAKESAAKDFGSIEKLLDRDRASINEKFGHIDKQLSNHITETNKKIDKLAEGQAKLEKGQIKLEANLEAKLEKKIDSLFKLYLKSPDKKQ